MSKNMPRRAHASAAENVQDHDANNDDSNYEYHEDGLHDKQNKPTGFRSLSLTFKIITCVMCVIMGMIFGFAMEKGRVFEPRMIRYQMIFKKMVMLKMFLSALATGMFGISVLAMIPRTHRHFFNACGQYYNSLGDKGILASIIGGSVLGVGMTISGSCPSSIFPQLGAMVPNAGYTFAGGLLGALTYGILKPGIDKLTRPMIQESSNPWVSSPYFIMALPIAAMFGVVVCSFELLVPWTRDVKMKNTSVNMLQLKAWAPYLSGIMIGSLQVPLMYFLGETLGGSTSFTVILSHFFVGPLRKLSPYITKHKWGFNVWWQVLFVAGAVYGAYLSASLSGFVGTAKGVSTTHALVGGFLIIFGARIAGGCTSGHGISGMSLLSILSVITTACMFAAAMATGFAMHAMGTLKI